MLARPTPRALNSVTSYGLVEMMRAFLEAGADPNGSYEDGFRPLHYVKHVEAARILIEAGFPAASEGDFAAVKSMS